MPNHIHNPNKDRRLSRDFFKDDEAQKFADFRAAGINRLSVGIQSFNAKHLQALGRVHDDIEARQNMAMASYFAALAFTRAGVGYVHAVSHNFGAYYHTPHDTPDKLDYERMARVMAGLQRVIAELATASSSDP